MIHHTTLSSASFPDRFIYHLHKIRSVERYIGKPSTPNFSSTVWEYIRQFYLHTFVSALRCIQEIITTCYPDSSSGVSFPDNKIVQNDCNKRPYSAISCLVALRLLVSYRRHCERVVYMKPSNAQNSNTSLYGLQSGDNYGNTCDFQEILDDWCDREDIYKGFVANSMELLRRSSLFTSRDGSDDVLYESLEENVTAVDEAMWYSWGVFVERRHNYNNAAVRGGDTQRSHAGISPLPINNNNNTSHHNDDVNSIGIRAIDSVIEGIGFLFMRRVTAECECSRALVDTSVSFYDVERINVDRRIYIKMFDFLERSLSKTLKERPGGILRVLYDVVDVEQRGAQSLTLENCTMAFWERDIFCELALFTFTYCRNIQTSRDLFRVWYDIFHRKRILREKEVRRQNLEIVLRPLFVKWKHISLDAYVKEEVRRKETFLISCIRAMNKRRVKLKLKRAVESKIKRHFFEIWSFATHGIGKFQKRLELGLKRRCFSMMLQVQNERTADRFYMLQLIKKVIEYWKVKLIQQSHSTLLRRRVLYHAIHQAKGKYLIREWKLRPLWSLWRAETVRSWAIQNGFIGAHRQKWAIFNKWKITFGNSRAAQFREKRLIREMLRILRARVDRRVATVILWNRAMSLLKRRIFTSWRMKVDFIGEDSAATRVSDVFHKRYLLIIAMRQWRRRLLICDELGAQCHRFIEYRNRQLLGRSFYMWIKNFPINRAFKTIIAKRTFSIYIECFFKWKTVCKKQVAKMEELFTVSDVMYVRLVKLNVLHKWIRKFHKRHLTVFGFNEDTITVHQYFSNCAKMMMPGLSQLYYDKSSYTMAALRIKFTNNNSTLHSYNPHFVRADGFRYRALLKRGFFFWASSLHFRRKSPVVAPSFPLLPLNLPAMSTVGYVSSPISTAPSSVSGDDVTACEGRDSAEYSDQCIHDERFTAKCWYRSRNPAVNAYARGPTTIGESAVLTSVVSKTGAFINGRRNTIPTVYTGARPPSAFTAAAIIAGAKVGSSASARGKHQLYTNGTFDHNNTDTVNDSIIVEECF